MKVWVTRNQGTENIIQSFSPLTIVAKLSILDAFYVVLYEMFHKKPQVFDFPLAFSCIKMKNCLTYFKNLAM